MMMEVSLHHFFSSTRSCIPTTLLAQAHLTRRRSQPQAAAAAARKSPAKLPAAEYDDVDDTTSSPSGVLSLNVKPDRNMTMALLDDYELEELDTVTDPNHRSGYVAVVGKPNVGKSTLSNQMIGQKLSIVTDKPQTTRHRVLGICSAPEYQDWFDKLCLWSRSSIRRHAQ